MLCSVRPFRYRLRFPNPFRGLIREVYRLTDPGRPCYVIGLSRLTSETAHTWCPPTLHLLWVELLRGKFPSHPRLCYWRPGCLRMRCTVIDNSERQRKEGQGKLSYTSVDPDTKSVKERYIRVAAIVSTTVAGS